MAKTTKKTEKSEQNSYYALVNQLVNHNMATSQRMDQANQRMDQSMRDILEMRKEFVEIKEQMKILIDMISQLPQDLQDKIGFANK